MDTWIQTLQKCLCWYPDINADELLACECEVCDHKCHSDKFRTMMDIVRVAKTYGYSAETHNAIKNCMDAMHSTDRIDQAYILNKRLSVDRAQVSMVQFRRPRCNHYDNALLRSQGYHGRRPKLLGATWKPHTTSYAVKDTPKSIKLVLPRPTSTLEKRLHAEAQRNANEVWTRTGILKYVDLNDSVKQPIDHAKVDMCYDRNLVVFPLKQAYKKCPNIFGEFFEFYNGTELASGPYQPTFKYMSATEVGNHARINDQSHTNVHRSDCSLWYTYHQNKYSALAQKVWQTPTRKSVVKKLRSQINLLQLDPPTTDAARYHMWLEIRPERKILAPLKLMTI